TARVPAARSTAAKARHRLDMSRSLVPLMAASSERTTPAGSVPPWRVTVATSLPRSRTRSHWIGDISTTALMNVATSALLGPYGPRCRVLAARLALAGTAATGAAIAVAA